MILKIEGAKTLNSSKEEQGKYNNYLRYLKAKEDEIKNKGKVIDAITTGLKESVSKIVPAKLALLPYEK